MKYAIEKWPGILAMEFDSEVLVNKAPTLQLANGKTARFMTQYDTKTLLFTVNSEDMGQKVTGLAEGAIESMHNLPVSVEGTKLSNGMNGSEAAVHEVPEYTGPLGTAGEEAAPTVEKSEYTGPLGTAGEEPAPTVEKPEFTGGVNAVEAAVHEVPEYTGPLATVGEEAAPTVEKPEFTGGVNAVEAAVHEVPEYTGPLGTSGEEPAPTVEKSEYTGGVNAVEAAVHELPEFKGGVNVADAAVHEIAEYKGADSLVTLAAEDYTYKAPLAQQTLPDTGNKESSLLASLGLTAFFLGLFAMGKKREE